MPKHTFTKDKSKGHLVDECFQGACSLTQSRKIRMGPCPEIAMPVSQVMSLTSETQRVSRECAPVEHDFSGENRVGARRARKANPPLVAQRYTKRRSVSQV